ncbi:MAG TPA: hypothetical protein VFL30_12465, partial [Rhodanobacteraceae bacterium]|nr:hypothetical protein [Rhodanobacteraceae bacterium]
MSLFDARGLAVTAADAEALARYEAAVASLVGQRADVAARTASALVHDPLLASAYCLRAAALVLTGTAAAHRPLAATLRVLDGLSTANERERNHAAAARAWLEGDPALALQRYAAIVAQYRRDIVALQVAHSLDFKLGHREMLRDRVAEVLPHWDDSVPGFGYLLGMHAFGLEENGDYVRAETTAREALRLTPDNAGAIHVITHIMEMKGRAREGIEWLQATRSVWAASAGFSTHLAWHSALFHIDVDEIPQALAIYVDTIAPRAAGSVAALIDATALLWRLELRGAHVRGLWRGLAHQWAQTSLSGERAFTIVHALLAFAAAGVEHHAARVAKLLRDDRLTRAANTAHDLALAIPLAEGFRAYGRGDYGA